MKTKDELMDELQTKVKNLIATTWEHSSVKLPDITAWLSQFEAAADIESDEQLHAMYLLSHFLYFDHAAIRELLKSVYRDLFRAPLLHKIRRDNFDTSDQVLIQEKFREIRLKTRFLGVGNPSESGVHLLYYFRQENSLPKSLFINSHEIFKRVASTASGSFEIRDPDIEYYVYIDDLCGSGKQATDYSRDLITPLKTIHPQAKVFYFVLFATTSGLQAVRNLGCFDEVAAVFELDPSFHCLEPNSRIFSPEVAPFIREKIRATCEKIGGRLWPSHPLGFENGQLLVGFSHNTPDNTLPIFWCDEYDDWRPIFKRYHKVYDP